MDVDWEVAQGGINIAEKAEFQSLFQWMLIGKLNSLPSRRYVNEVSILVSMDVDWEAYAYPIPTTEAECFNPCFNGC